MGRVYAMVGWTQIDRLSAAGSMVGLSDRQILDRFLAGESAEAAFEALVDRRGPMVRSVGRSILRDAHEADDAFQATFLVLARRAGAIPSRARSMASHAAWRPAARADAARRRLLERLPTYHVNFRPQDKSSIVVEIVRENPLLLRAPIMAPRNLVDPSQPKSVSP